TGGAGGRVTGGARRRVVGIGNRGPVERQRRSPGRSIRVLALEHLVAALGHLVAARGRRVTARGRRVVARRRFGLAGEVPRERRERDPATEVAVGVVDLETIGRVDFAQLEALAGKRLIVFVRAEHAKPVDVRGRRLLPSYEHGTIAAVGLDHGDGSDVGRPEIDADRFGFLRVDALRAVDDELVGLASRLAAVLRTDPEPGVLLEGFVAAARRHGELDLLVRHHARREPDGRVLDGLGGPKYAGVAGLQLHARAELAVDDGVGAIALMAHEQREERVRT